ncbi:electron transfer flavoprotein subunit alpha/FixB family protein [Pokkaliibacter sp. MBI-7]|uniref:electron transfer flavoprotein subunit alpha n=1 Tax=Pokkaliibacter sp. MBI-7 TaxID=3040600 RepID=UPI002447E2D1|nr:electron transfer flavoprotein subunit alpha/FixB family protein [Pokkaliibacter sp. MBI-7]MDH2431420.1 electron transfer flavoprotein subunit alpha/FixB family protein [Pokkaliibacter sp. MBI-7]
MSDIIRRDPRREWILRNRLHPLHASLAAPQDQWMGPNGVVRKNPHAVGFIGPNGIKRIDRSGGQTGDGGSVRRSGTTEVQLPLFRVEQPAFYVVVVPDMVGGRLTSHDKDVLGLAHQLVRQTSARTGSEGAVLAVVFGAHKESGFDTAGVDRLLQLDDSKYTGYAPEQRLNVLTTLERTLEISQWLLPDSLEGGGDLGRRLAAKLKQRPATQAWALADGQVTCRAAGQREDWQRPASRILLMANECAEPVSETRHEAKPLLEELVRQLELPALISRIEDKGQVAVDPSAVPLGEAEFILSAGNGIRDFALFHNAASVLRATEGASRVAVDNGDMPRFRQVGATGTWVTARVYLAVGISGAVQHLQGIGQCDKVIAINTDPGCDMVKRADLSVIADSTDMLAALIKLVDGYRGAEEGEEDAA